MSAIDALQACSLFKEFTETGLKIFSAIATEKAVPAGSPLFVENMVGESLFIVKSGQVRLTVRDGGQDRELALLGPGDHVGSLGLLAKCVRLVSAVAATACEVVEIAQRDYHRLQPQKPQACLKLALAIAADLAQQANDNRDALRSLAAPGKG